MSNSWRAKIDHPFFKQRSSSAFRFTLHLILALLLFGASTCKENRAPSPTDNTGQNPNSSNVNAPPSCPAWVEESSSVEQDLSAVDFIDDSTGWVVGDI